MLLMVVAAAAQTPHDAKAKWLADNSHPVRSIDPDDDDFRDLQFLKKTIGNARVVQLGDQTHGDGATIYARSRLIRFLHQQMGFDVLVWEGGFFDCEQMNEAIVSEMPIERVARQGLHPISAQSGLLRPLFRYVRSTFQTERPLRQSGLDVQDFLGDPSEPGASLSRLMKRIDDIDAEMVSLAERVVFEAIVNSATRGVEASASERQERQRAVTGVLARLTARTGVDSRETLVLAKALENLISLDEMALRQQSADPASKIPAGSLYRDQKMGETLLWLMNRLYRGRKLIVAVGGGHAAHRIGALYAEAEKSSFKDYRTMGDVIHEQLGRDVYTIQFAAYQGQYGAPSRPVKTLATPRPGSLEDLWHTADSRYAFLDLRSVPQGHWLRGPIAARPFGYTEQEATWADHFDAFFYTDRMFPSSRDGSVPEGVKTKARVD